MIPYPFFKICNSESEFFNRKFSFLKNIDFPIIKHKKEKRVLVVLASNPVDDQSQSLRSKTVMIFPLVAFPKALLYFVMDILVRTG